MLKTPTYQLSIGKSGKQKYMQIKLKRYQGRYVEISLKKGNAAFKKASMVSDKIAYYHGKILFTYQKGGVVYSCKLRTYLIKNGRKKYSAYSKVKSGFNSERRKSMPCSFRHLRGKAEQ